jgi:hypothetical protein
VGSLLEHQADKSAESAANQLVGVAVGLFVGGTKGSQLGVGMVVGLVLETVSVPYWWPQSGGWSGSRDVAIMLGKKVCRGATIADNDCVIINVIVIICQDLEGVVVSCQTLGHDR